MSQTSVDVIVPVFGHWEMVQRCLVSLTAQTVGVRVIVVDDCSPDDTPDLVARGFPNVDLVRQPVNSGFAAACNAGFAHGSADIVILVNSDVEADSRMVEELVSAFAAAEIASASPLILRPDGRLDAAGITADPTLAGFVRYHGASMEAAERRAPELLGPYGAVAAYRRSALPGGELFDEGIFMYGEELDLALRLRGLGSETVLVPSALATHIGGATTGKGSSRQLYLAGFGRGYIIGKYRIHRSRHVVRVVITETLVVLLRLLRSRDAAPLLGRLAGFRAGRRRAHAKSPMSGLEPRIGFVTSLRMRSPSYWERF